MKNGIYGLLMMLAFGITLTCFAGGDEEAFDPAPVLEAIKKFGEVTDRGPVDAIAALYTKDAMIMPNNGVIVRGREAIKKFWAGDQSKNFLSTKHKTVEISGSGDLAFQINTYRFAYVEKGEKPDWHPSKNVHIWKKTGDGTWKLHVDIWNSSGPN